jgi:type IV pilus assembly protein PilE
MKAVKQLNSKGFTLMEILIVLVILAVIVGLAIPIYQSTSKKVYRAEALNILSGLRQSEARYYAQKNKYTNNITGATNDLDFEPTSVQGNAHFTYSMLVAGTLFTAKATGSTTPLANTDTVTLTESGTMVSSF